MNSRNKIGVLLVDDSLVDLKILERMITTSPDIEILGTARNGKEALSLLPQLRPKVVCTDLHMPHMDGLSFTKAAMVDYPVPILVISSHVGAEQKQTIFDLLQAGAIDVFPKPSAGLNDAEACRTLVEKIRILSGVFVFRKRNTTTENTPPLFSSSIGTTTQKGVIAIGTSTGGPPALADIFGGLDATFPVPILCVQHIGHGFLHGLVSWLNSKTALHVKILDPNEDLKTGTVYFAAEDQHLEARPNYKAITSNEAPWQGHRPSVNQLFFSVAKHYGKNSLGILLTGMGKDGAEGLLAMKQAGGQTITQDESSSVVFGMPAVAIALGAAQQILPLHEISSFMIQWTIKKTKQERNG